MSKPVIRNIQDLVNTHTTQIAQTNQLQADNLTQLNLKANQVDINAQIASIASGSPKATYATLALLQTAFPTGTTGIYIVTADGKWYYWNGSAWTAGGVYQSTALAVNGTNYYNIASAMQDPLITSGKYKTVVLTDDGTAPLNGATYDTPSKTFSIPIGSTGDGSYFKFKNEVVGLVAKNMSVTLYFKISTNDIASLSPLPRILSIKRNGVVTALSIDSSAPTIQLNDTDWLFGANFTLQVGDSFLYAKLTVGHVSSATKITTIKVLDCFVLSNTSDLIDSNTARISANETNMPTISTSVIVGATISETGIDYSTGNNVSSPGGVTTNKLACGLSKYLTIVGRSTWSSALIFYDISSTKIKPTGSANYSTATPNGTFAIPTGAVTFALSYGTTSGLAVILGISDSTTGGKVTNINGVPFKADGDPSVYCTGSGSATDPYVASDGFAGFPQTIASFGTRGGKVRVPAKTFSVSTAVRVTTNVHIEGDIWNYSGYPNGVYPSEMGSKLALLNANIAAIELSTIGAYGVRIAQIGIQGMVLNSNTQGLFSVANNGKHCGISLLTGADQCELYRITCTGLAVGISAYGYIDACLIDRVNTDGCNVGIYFHPRGSYYTKIKDSIIADCPSQGIWVGKVTDPISTLILDGLVLVRNCGGITSTQLLESEAASALITGVDKSRISNCQIVDTGNWSEYFTVGDGVTPTKHTVIATGLILDGTTCMVVDNIIDKATGHSAIFRGSANQIINNYFGADDCVLISGNSMKFSNNDVVTAVNSNSVEVDGNNNILRDCTINKPIYITGNNNRVINCYSTATLSNLIIVETGATGTILQGYDVSQVIDRGTGTVIK